MKYRWNEHAKEKGAELFRHRSTKVFAAVLITIAIEAAVLRTLGTNPLPAGAFSLSEYNHLAPIEKVISSNVVPISRHWNSIEISYTNTKPIVVNRPSSQNNQVNYNVLNYHFVVWNGLVGGNGQIQSTEKWQNQLSTTPDQTWSGCEETIHIGIIADNKVAYPTDFQIKRTEALVRSLSREFGIESESIYYPWW